MCRTVDSKANRTTVRVGQNGAVGGASDSVASTMKNDKVVDACQESPQSTMNFLLFDDKDESSPVRVEWSEMDFPPLGDVRGERRAEYGVWGEKKPYDHEADRCVVFELFKFLNILLTISK
jgi:hypothetical protein